MRPRLAVALDVPDAEAARRHARLLAGHADLLKIGLELFVAEGPDLVREIQDLGWGIFLDLKLHDIPATVAGGVRSAARLGVKMLTVHAAGGERMLRAAREASAEVEGPRLLAVTVLTSLDAGQLADVGVASEPREQVSRLTGVAARSGCDGVVASVLEAAEIKQLHGRDFLVVTPGIRPAGSSTDDQARVATPAAAVRAGADVLVVGRPILRADDPVAAAGAIRREMAGAERG